MTKKYKLFALLPFLLLASCGAKEEISYNKDGYQMKEISDNKVVVSFFYNYNKQTFSLSSGMNAISNSLVYKTLEIDKGSKVSAPETNPNRSNYLFDGWHTSATDDSSFDFNKEINSNTVIYAHWTKTSQQEETFVEPVYKPNFIDNTLTTSFRLDGVLNMPVNSGSVNLSTAAILRLKNTKTNCVSALNYKCKSGVTVSATYDENSKVISYSATGVGNPVNGTIQVNDVSLSLVVSNSYYENKAKKYEENSQNFTDYHIMLAGSSSMENWSTSTEDLLPMTTYNHGIGGTTVDEWKNCLNQRLVYPYNPKTVVYYVGVNNLINAGTGQEDTARYLVEMFDDVHAHLPNTKIYYVLINALPGYMNYLSAINYVNAAAINYEKTHSYVTTLDAGNLLLKENGKPNSAYFLSDGLHMSLYGYVLWGGFIKNKLIEDMKNNA